MLKKVILYQQKPGVGIPEKDLRTIEEENPDFLCFPEYFFVGDDVKSQIETAWQTPKHREWLAAISRKLGCTVIGGSLVEKEGSKLYNTCLVYSKGKQLGSYRKLNPFGRETTLGISPGEGLDSFAVQGVRVSILICADVLIPGIFKRMRRLKPDLVFCPTTSPLREKDTEEAKEKRDLEIFVAGARDSGAYVVKTCAAGSLMNRKLQGRSLVAAPWGIVKRVAFHREHQEAIVVATLNLDILRGWRAAELTRSTAGWHSDTR